MLYGFTKRISFQPFYFRFCIAVRNIIEGHEINELMIEIHIEGLKSYFSTPEFFKACTYLFTSI